ncbi:uncharacterized protein [Lepeophtheirus salmonis]|uniref:uncharacterized protein n=1 Tax=Lepeophtheirus salmonis TaxID=72036 RepID=UPI001AE5BF44|nr:polyserase-2-like [Lepeophtheirus salmonis]XP_040568729.1 polyserase-2-like [Lepeophtheirus salmonis]
MNIILCVLLFMIVVDSTLISAYNINDLKDLCGIPSDSSLIRSATCRTSISSSDYPWQVSIVGRDGIHWCTGTLITDRHILSSAHCFFHESCGNKCKILSVALYELHFGRSNRTDFINPKTKQRSNIPDDVDVVRGIGDIFIPSDFDMRDAVRDGNDIAVILIDEPIQFRAEILPACLPDSKSKDIFDVGGVGYVGGFSHIRSGNEAPLSLQAFRMDIIPEGSCIKNLLVFGYDEFDAPDTICAKSTFRCSRKEESSICRGDAGGPLMSPFKNDLGLTQWIVGGVHAFGPKLCGKSKTNIPIYFTRVQEYISFIHRIVNIDQASTTPLTTPRVSTTTSRGFTPKSIIKNTPKINKSPLPFGQANFKCTDSEEGYICRHLTDGKRNKQTENNLVCGNTQEGYSCIFKIPKNKSQIQNVNKKKEANTSIGGFKRLNVRSKLRPNSLRSSTTPTTILPPSPVQARVPAPITTNNRAPKFIQPAQRQKVRIQGTYRIRGGR